MAAQTQIKSPVTIRKETEAKIRTIQRKLDEMRQYKLLISEENLKPDIEDKRKESDLIIRLLRLEKLLDPEYRKQYAASQQGPVKAFGKAKAKAGDKEARAHKRGVEPPKATTRPGAQPPRRARGPAR